MRRGTVAGLSNQRRQAIFDLLRQAPNSYNEIIAGLKRKHLLVYDHADSPDAIARKLYYQFIRDLKALRLQYKIQYDSKAKHYWLVEAPFSLSLDQKHLVALAMISHTFADKTFPYPDDIQHFLPFLLNQFPNDHTR